MKKVLIVTYYWPPSGGAGVQRWLKFVKYLTKEGWTPIIYTPENPELPAEDLSLMKDVPEGVEVLKTKIWEPFEVYKKATGKKDNFASSFLSEEESSTSFMQKLALWVRGNLFIPDAKMFWIRPSIRFLHHYLRNNPVDIIVSTGPPHSLHLIARGVQKKFPNIKWVADFRDPWTNIDFYKELMISSLADKKHKRLEKMVLDKADAVVVVGPTMKKEFLQIKNRPIEVITNGFDSDDILDSQLVLSTSFSITHVGSLNKDRNPVVLWQALQQLIKNDAECAKALEIKLVGKVDAVIEKSIDEMGLSPYLKRISYLPHNQIVSVLQQSAVLLLVINDTPNSKGILTGKFFEYLSVKRPVFAVGPEDGDIAEILKETKSGAICGFNNFDGTLEVITQMWNDFVQNKLEIQSEGIDQYSRKALTDKMIRVFENVMQ